MLLVIMLLLCNNNAFGQTENEYVTTTLRDKLYFGGNLGVQFGTITNIDVSPLIGYEITQRLSAGLGATYKYYKNNSYDISTYIYGGRVFSRIQIFKMLFLHFEIEPLNIEDFYFDYGERKWITNVNVGAGYVQPLGKRSSINLMVLWNINETTLSPYENPIIRVGFSF